VVHKVGDGHLLGPGWWAGEVIGYRVADRETAVVCRRSCRCSRPCLSPDRQRRALPPRRPCRPRRPRPSSLACQGRGVWPATRRCQRSAGRVESEGLRSPLPLVQPLSRWSRVISRLTDRGRDCWGLFEGGHRLTLRRGVVRHGRGSRSSSGSWSSTRYVRLEQHGLSLKDPAAAGGALVVRVVYADASR
jgi:hypothetical protein